MMHSWDRLDITSRIWKWPCWNLWSCYPLWARFCRNRKRLGHFLERTTLSLLINIYTVLPTKIDSRPGRKSKIPWYATIFLVLLVVLSENGLNPTWISVKIFPLNLSWDMWFSLCEIGLCQRLWKSTGSSPFQIAASFLTVLRSMSSLLRACFGKSKAKM